MRSRYLCLFLVIALALLAGPAAAQVPEVVKRYIDDSTIGVGRLDLAAVRSDAILDFMGELMQEAPERDRERLLSKARQWLEEVDRTTAQLREQGVTRAWLVMGPDTLTMMQPPLVIVPVENDAQAKLVTDLMAASGEEHHRVEGAVIIGAQRAVAAAQAAPAVDRPGFAEHFTGEGAAALFVVEPTPVLRMAAEMALQQASQSPAVPADASKLVEPLQWMKLSMALPPEPRGELTIQFADAASAERARALIASGVETARKALEADAAAGDGEALALLKLSGRLAPEAQESRVVMTIDNADLQEAFGGEVLTKLADQSARVVAASNLRMLGQGIRMYTIQNQGGAYPASIDNVAQYLGRFTADAGPTPEETLRELMTNPRTGGEDAFVYLRPDVPEKDIRWDRVLMYEKPPAGAGEDYEVAVLHADGSVRTIPVRELHQVAEKQGFEVEEAR